MFKNTSNQAPPGKTKEISREDSTKIYMTFCAQT